MKVLFDAWLEQGAPRLRIVDSESGQVRLYWSYDRLAEQAAELPASADSETPTECGARLALHQLVRKLFLLSCADRLQFATSNDHPRADACLHCRGCISGTQMHGLRKPEQS